MGFIPQFTQKKHVRRSENRPTIRSELGTALLMYKEYLNSLLNGQIVKQQLGLASENLVIEITMLKNKVVL